MKDWIVGITAGPNKVHVNGVERVGSAALKKLTGQIQVMDAMERLEDLMGTNVVNQLVR